MKKNNKFPGFCYTGCRNSSCRFLPGNKKATKRDGTSTSADDNQESIFLTVKMQILKLITMKVRQIKSNCLIL